MAATDEGTTERMDAAPLPPSTDAAAARYEALASLRRDFAAQDPGLPQRLPDGFLHVVANSPVTTAEEIRSHGFPPAVIELADPIASALAAVAGVAAESAPVAASAPPPPPPVESAPPRDAGAPAGLFGADPSQLAFASYTGARPPGRIEPVRIDLLGDGRYALAWTRGSGPFVDRIVRGDEHAPYNPDRAQVVAVTDEGRAIDGAPFGHTVRHYQVWRHAAPSIEEAALQQPQLVATGVVVAPPHDIEVHQDEGAVVVGLWGVLEGTRAVQVYRVPVRQAFTAGVGNPQYRIQADRALLKGFEDKDAEPGQTYVYQLVAEADTGDEIHTSTAIMREVTLAQIHRPVTDLQYVQHAGADAAFFDLTWTEPPGGTVVIYRTREAPAAGYDTHPIAVSALEQAGLVDDARVLRPPEHDGDRSIMRNVPWPGDWGRAYFTPVVVIGDRGYLGNTVRGVRQQPPSRLKVIERVDQQLLTFDFPEGAHDVQVHIAARNVPAEAVLAGQPAATISRAQYDTLGSLRLTPQQLPVQSTIYAVALANDGTRTVASIPDTIDYDPVRVVRYQVNYSMGIGAAGRRPTVTLQSDVDYPPELGIGFVLAFHPERLPLSVQDAVDQVGLVRDIDGESTVVRRFVASGLKATGFREPGWKADPAGWSEIARQAKKGGYLRLFVDDPQYQRRLALLDPDLKSLRLGGFLGGLLG